MTKALTERQQAVLDLVNQGKNPTEIGKELGISSQGVHGHLRRLRTRGLIPGDGGAAPQSDEAVSPDTAFEAVRRAAAEQKAKLERHITDIDAEVERLQEQIKARRAEKRDTEKAIEKLGGLSV